MAKKNWYQKGKAGKKRAEELDREAKARRDAQGPRRFWLEYDSSAKATFLDTPSFFLLEHNLKIGNSFYNYFTCVQDMDTCPLCEAGENPSYILVGTVINHKKWTDKKDVVHQHEKQLFVAKGKAREHLLKQIERREDDLSFCIYELSRGSSSTECATGEDFEYLKRISKTNLAKVPGVIPEGKDESYLTPFDYEKIFAPKSMKELRKLVGGDAPVGGEEEDASEAALLGGDEKTAGKEVESASSDGPESIDDLI